MAEVEHVSLSHYHWGLAPTLEGSLSVRYCLIKFSLSCLRDLSQNALVELKIFIVLRISEKSLLNIQMIYKIWVKYI